MYADDAKLFNSVSDQRDVPCLQADLDTLKEWSAEWQLRFNIDKCKVMHIGRSNRICYTMQDSKGCNCTLQVTMEEMIWEYGWTLLWNFRYIWKISTGHISITTTQPIQWCYYKRTLLQTRETALHVDCEKKNVLGYRIVNFWNSLPELVLSVE